MASRGKPWFTFAKESREKFEKSDNNNKPVTCKILCKLNSLFLWILGRKSFSIDNFYTSDLKLFGSYYCGKFLSALHYVPWQNMKQYVEYPQFYCSNHATTFLCWQADVEHQLINSLRQHLPIYFQSHNHFVCSAIF